MLVANNCFLLITVQQKILLLIVGERSKHALLHFHNEQQPFFCRVLVNYSTTVDWFRLIMLTLCCCCSSHNFTRQNFKLLRIFETRHLSSKCQSVNILNVKASRIFCYFELFLQTLLMLILPMMNFVVFMWRS